MYFKPALPGLITFLLIILGYKFDTHTQKYFSNDFDLQSRLRIKVWLIVQTCLVKEFADIESNIFLSMLGSLHQTNWNLWGKIYGQYHIYRYCQCSSLVYAAICRRLFKRSPHPGILGLSGSFSIS